MKRALLIAGGTIGGLGAVLAITPPQLGSSQAVGMSSGMGSTSGGSASSTSSTAATTASAAPSASSTSATPARTVKKVVKKVVAKATSQATTSTQNSATQATPSATPSATPTQTQSSTPTPAPAKVVVPAPAKNTANGTFTGPSVFVSYGNVQVEITVRDGKIVDAQALQSPNGRSQRFSDYALPQLRQETLAAQSSSISNISGASYTSYGWYKSLQGALAKAGL